MNLQRTKKIATLVAGVGLVATVPAVTLASSAEASAYGCTPYTSVRIKGLSPANWCGGPNGSGLRLDTVTASFASSIAGVGYLCDTRMKVEVANDRGNVVWTGYSATQYGCGQAGGAFRINVYRTFATNGTVRTSLLSYGATKATLSHNLKR